jgi:hypothetical protein
MRGLKHESIEVEPLDPEVESVIGDECDAFLRGAYLDTLHRGGHRAPVWTWLNEAAHGEAEQLRTTASFASLDDGDVELRTRITVAIAVTCAMHDRTLVDLQRELLVPLELALAGTDLTPRRLIELVGRALYR